jgi:hypothetical protein
MMLDMRCKLFTIVCCVVSMMVHAQEHYEHDHAHIYQGSRTYFSSAQVFSLANVNNRTKELNRSGLYRLSSTDTFAQISTAVSNPMMKVTGSTVEIDLNGMQIISGVTTGAGYVGIEVGLRPNETGDQVSHVLIKNGVIKNFDCAILIHAGVQNVTLENIEIVNSSVGVACMGLSTGGLYDGSVVSIVCDGVRVMGSGLDNRVALVNLKTLLETTYTYGQNTFMPLRQDPLNGNAQDVYSYYGMFMTYVTGLVLKNCLIQGIGYANYNTFSEGDGERTEALGIVIKNSSHINIDQSAVELMTSEVKAVGIQFDACYDISLSRTQANNQTSKTQAIGLELFSATSPTLIAKSLFIDTCECNLNYSDDTAMGANLSKVQDVFITNSFFNRNNGKKTCYGLYSSKMNYADISATSMSANIADNGSIATANGVYAAGIHFEDVDGGTKDILAINLTDVQACMNIGTNSGRGIFIKGGSAICCNRVNASLNEGTSLRSSEAATLLSDQGSAEISKHLGVVTKTGGVGIWLENAINIQAYGVRANYNQGVRAAGIMARSCSDLHFVDCVTSSQQATGSCFDSSLGSQTATALSVVSEQRQLLYGGATISTINTKYATDKFLASMANVKAAQLAVQALSYDDLKTIASAIVLLQAGVARFRLWGTAVGLHMHNSSGCFVQRHTSKRNSSAKDSAMGLAFTGQVQACTVIDSDFSYNHGWTDSVRTNSASTTVTHTYDLTEVYPFWDMLAAPFGTPNTTPTSDGFWQSATSTSTDTGIYGSFVAQNDGATIRLDGTAYAMVNPVGPCTIGCLVGDAALDVVVQNNLMQGNNGNAGQVYGLLLDIGFATIVKENKIYGSYVSSYGFGFGFAEFNTHSSSIQLKNECFANRVATFYNANYMILYNPGDVSTTLSFQSTSAYNGNLTVADNLNDGQDNFEVKYSQDALFYDIESTTDAVVDATLVARWTDDANDWVA